MSKKTVSMIVAAAENGIIGKNGDMPWRLSADLKNFKQITMGSTIIMGRKTWDSIQRLLPGRTTVIVTRQEDFHVEGAIVVNSLDAALSATEDPSPFVVGGAEIYRLALPQVTRIYLTRVHAQIEGDTVMPGIDFSRWKVLESNRHSADEKNSHDYSFEIYEKVAAGEVQ
ncbi:dihydrofolate reductase [Mariniblastus fucicola]|uniref:Dihydrofolate reductase n=1 Tax=Mariniblastus fucicola TaxID=980251 RepID=A0A5B9P6G7_9BACT|nr:dihydrofolate reductase [Mariniblastus fucicola]QEG20592.1 Dihydrofolate reductase [Mariniblastus fucicola]